MQLNYLAIIVASVVEFGIGAVWYMPLFGKLWGKIHDFDKHSKAEQEKMAKAMGPWYGVQLLVTLITTTVLAILMNAYSMWSPFSLAFLLWLGFVVPTQASAVIFGGTNPRWIWTKIAVMAGGQLACLLAAAMVLKIMG